MTTKAHEPFEIVDKRRIAIKEHGLATVTEPEPLTLESVDCIYDDPLPIFDRVLIRRNAKETTFAGTHFHIPESAQKSANRGVVVATAEFFIIDGKPLSIKDVAKVEPGDVVTFSAFNTEDIDVDGEVFTECSVFDLKLIEKRHFALGVS